MRNIKIGKQCKMHIKSIDNGRILQDLVINVKITNIENTARDIKITVQDEHGISYSLYHTQKDRGLLVLLKTNKFFSYISKCGSAIYVQNCIY